MNFIPHVFKKDLSRLKILLFAWVVLIAAQSALGIGGIKIAAEMFEFQMFLPMLTMLLGFLQGMMILVMVPLIIQEDSIVGTTAFWLTRPISKKGLLITKTTFIFGILIAMPLMAEIFVLAANGVMGGHLLLAVPEIMLEKTVFVVPFFLLAVLTPKFSRYALTGIIVFAGFTVFGIIASVAMMFVPGMAKFFYNYSFYNNPSVEASLSVAKGLYIIVVGFALIIHQCVTRYSARTMRWFVVAYLLLICFSRIWTWDFLFEKTNVTHEEAIADSLQLGLDRSYVIINDERRYKKSDPREKAINVKIFAEGLPEDQFANLNGLEDVRIKFSDGVVIQSGYISVQARENFSNEKFMPVLQAALGKVRIVNPFYGRFTHTEILSLEDGDINTYKDRKGTYLANASFDVYEYQKVAEIPLVQGAKAAFSSQQVIVYDVLERTHGVSVIVGEKKTNLLFDRTIRKTSRYDMAQEIYSDFKSVYLIVNRKRGEAFLAESGGDLNFAEMPSYNPTRLETKAKQFDFTYVNDRNTALPKTDEEWLSDAVLVRLDAVRLGTKTVKVNIENFEIPTQSTSVKTDLDDIDHQLREQEKQMQRWQ